MPPSESITTARLPRVDARFARVPHQPTAASVSTQPGEHSETRIPSDSLLGQPLAVVGSAAFAPHIAMVASGKGKRSWIDVTRWMTRPSPDRALSVRGRGGFEPVTAGKKFMIRGHDATHHRSSIAYPPRRGGRTSHRQHVTRRSHRPPRRSCTASSPPPRILAEVTTAANEKIREAHGGPRGAVAGGDEDFGTGPPSSRAGYRLADPPAATVTKARRGRQIRACRPIIATASDSDRIAAFPTRPLQLDAAFRRTLRRRARLDRTTHGAIVLRS
jgi:hypothetical protein